MKHRLLALFLTIGSCSFAFGKPCFSIDDNGLTQQKTNLWGREISYFSTTVSSDWFYPQEILTNSSVNDLYIGFEGYHSYFVFRNQRYDGGFVPLLLKSQFSHHNGRLNKGLIVRIRDVPDDLAEPLIRYLKKRDLGLAFTCSQGLCSVLGRNGIHISGLSVYPTNVLKNILTRGVQTQDGQNLSAELILVNTPSLQRHLSDARAIELAASGLALFFLAFAAVI